MRYFNTAGPCTPTLHYMIPAAERLPEARELAEQGMYFVVHAPRQTGKTTTLMALAKSLTEGGKLAALHFSCEAGEPAGDDYVQAQRAILDAMRRRAAEHLPEELRPPGVWPQASDLTLLEAALTAWAKNCPRPLVLIFDEIDALRGEGLRSVLRQLRSSYPYRPTTFPHSVILCGLRDVRDYKAASGGDPNRLGTSSPFNIKIKSLRLGDFTRDEVRALYRQHEEEAGLAFTAEAIEKAFELTQGQPWLINALAEDVTRGLKVPPPTPITPDHVEEAKERLILARATHLDSLVARLHEPRVQRVIEPLLSGNMEMSSSYQDDVEYVRDLGLVAADRPARIANPIYREVIVRVLASGVEEKVETDPRSFVLKDGRLDLRRLLDEFVVFWRLNGEVLTKGIAYHEVAPQLVLMAFLQRIVNGGGYVEREYGVGRGRIDLLVRWPYPGPGGRREWQREAMELRVWRAGRPNPLAEGLAQLDGYLDRMVLEEGTLVIFDRRNAAGGDESAPAETRIEDSRTPKGREVRLVRL